MNAAQLALILFAGLTVWYLFVIRREWLWEKTLSALHIIFGGNAMPAIAGLIIWIVRAILIGYCVYLLTLFILSFSRIESFFDIWLLLSSRPSTFGGRGVISVLVGIIYAGWGYSGGNVQQARIFPEKGDREISPRQAKTELTAIQKSVEQEPVKLQSIDKADKAIKPKSDR